MKKTIIPLITLSASVLMTQAAVLTLSTDTANPSPAFNTSFSGTLNDPFAYDEFNPTSASPDRILTTTGEATANGYHGTGAGDVVLRYTLTGGAHTVAAGQTIVMDLWGRDSTVFNESRDDDFDVRLYNGDYVTSVAAVLNQGIAAEASNPNHHHRVSFSGFSGTFDRVEITARISNTETSNNFALLETRLASVPEPSSAVLFGLGSFALMLRRRR